MKFDEIGQIKTQCREKGKIRVFGKVAAIENNTIVPGKCEESLDNAVFEISDAIQAPSLGEGIWLIENCVASIKYITGKDRKQQPPFDTDVYETEIDLYGDNKTAKNVFERIATNVCGRRPSIEYKELKLQ